MKQMIAINTTWITGLLMAGAGLWMIWPPLAMIAVGTVLTLTATIAVILPIILKPRGGKGK